MGLHFIIILACQVSLARCELYQGHTGFRNGTECSRQLEKKMGAMRVQLPVSGNYTLVGWCGLPLSGMKEKS